MGDCDPPLLHQVLDVQFQITRSLFHGPTQFGRAFRFGFGLLRWGYVQLLCIASARPAISASKASRLSRRSPACRGTSKSSYSVIASNSDWFLSNRMNVFRSSIFDSAGADLRYMSDA